MFRLNTSCFQSDTSHKLRQLIRRFSTVSHLRNRRGCSFTKKDVSNVLINYLLYDSTDHCSKND